MKYAVAMLLLAGCHPLHVDYSRVVDMQAGKEFYEAKKVESYLNTK